MTKYLMFLVTILTIVICAVIVNFSICNRIDEDAEIILNHIIQNTVFVDVDDMQQMNWWEYTEVDSLQQY